MQRKLRKVSGVLVLTIPRQICDLYNFKEGDIFKLEPIGITELKLKKIEGVSEERQISTQTL